jgi:hypothetical protein
MVSGPLELIKAALPEHPETILSDAGGQLMQGLWTALRAKWTEFTAWFQDQINKLPQLPGLPGSSTPNTVPPPERHGAGGGSRGTEDPALAQAYGGLGGAWTWVGERGRELVKLARGSMVIPAGASETRARAMAYGGVVDSEPRAYPGGKFYDKGRVWSEALQRWVSQAHADRAAMRGGPTRRALSAGSRDLSDSFQNMGYRWNTLLMTASGS